MAAGRRKPFNQRNKSNKPNTRRRLSVKSNHKPRSSSGRLRLFVDGGVLSDWPSDFSSPTRFRGRNRNASRPKWTPKLGNSDRLEAWGFQKPNGNVFGYRHSSYNLQEDPNAESCVVSNNRDTDLEVSHPIVLCDSEETRIIAYTDQTPVSKPQNEEFIYGYGSSFVLGDSSYRGPGFYNESEVTPSSYGSSSMHVEESIFNLSYSEKEMDAHQNFNYEVRTEMEEEMVNETSRKRNSSFVTIGGMNIYTQDISDVEIDEDGNVESSEPEQTSSESDSSEDMTDIDSDIDVDVAEDYLEGIGGSNNILDAKWLVDMSHVDTPSSSCDEENLEKYGGIAIPGASREHGRKKARSRKKNCVAARNVWSLDDLTLTKDPRKFSAKQKSASQFPQSWPLGAQKSASSRHYSGERKKHRKEMIAVKRRERSCLEKLIGAGKEACDFASGKKNRAAKTRKGSGLTLRDSQQSDRSKSSEKRRRGKTGSYVNQPLSFVSSGIMGSETVKVTSIDSKETNDSNDDNDVSTSAEFGAFEVHTTGFGSKMMAKIGFTEGGGLGKDGQGMAKPIEVIKWPKSLGLGVEFSNTDGESKETNDVTDRNGEAGSSFGSFEVHTTGFGSKMMAKMGFIEGGGLGKDGQGMAKPIEAIKWPKSLGLGADFSNTNGISRDLPKNKSWVGDATTSNSHKVRAFEKHTKGFGSKMKGKDGFRSRRGFGQRSTRHS